MAAKRVLIVDDALELGRLLQAALSTLDPGFQVTVVPSAEEAQLEASRRQADLVITDIHLPGISGLELTRRLHARYKTTRIILITGLNEPTIRQQAMDAGADFFFKKPVSMPEFLAAVQQLLGMAKVEPPPPPVNESLPRPQTDRISEALAATRHALAAYAVVLLDDHGHILVQDGDLTERDLDPGLLPALMNTLSASEKVARYLGTKSLESVFIFRARTFELVLSPLGGAFAFLVLLKTGRSSVKLAIAVDEVINVHKEMEHILADMGVAIHPQSPMRAANPDRGPVLANTGPLNPQLTRILSPKPTANIAPSSTNLSNNNNLSVTNSAPPPVNPFGPPPARYKTAPTLEPTLKQENSEGALETLLGSSEKASLKPEDIDAFWDAAEKGETASRLVLPDKLSYEQARQMGLAPDTNKP